MEERSFFFFSLFLRPRNGRGEIGVRLPSFFFFLFSFRLRWLAKSYNIPHTCVCIDVFMWAHVHARWKAFNQNGRERERDRKHRGEEKQKNVGEERTHKRRRGGGNKTITGAFPHIALLQSSALVDASFRAGVAAHRWRLNGGGRERRLVRQQRGQQPFAERTSKKKKNSQLPLLHETQSNKTIVFFPLPWAYEEGSGGGKFRASVT